MSIFAILFRKWTYNIPIKANIPQDFSRSLTPFALFNVCADVSRRMRQKAKYHHSQEKSKKLLWSYKEYLIGYPQDSKNLTVGFL